MNGSSPAPPRTWAGRASALVALALATALSAAAGSGAAAQRPPAAPRNVLLILVDDLRPELGAYGSRTAVTPNIDRLASRGLVFDRAFTQIAVCGPSRAALLSGLRPDSTRIYRIGQPLREAVPGVTTLPQHFRRHGFTTLSLGKVYHHVDEDPQGWSEPAFLTVGGWEAQDLGWRGRGYLAPESIREVEALARANPNADGRGPAYEAASVPDSAYPDGLIAGRAVAALRRLRDRPFFLAVGFAKPHLPFNAPRRYWEMHPPESVRLPERSAPPTGATRFSLADFGELRAYTNIPKQGPVSDEQARTLIRGYRASVSYTDAQVGRVLDELDRLGLAESTIVVLWGDHGYKLGEYASWVKHSAFEVDTRIPLIVRAPGMRAAGRRSPAFVESVDLYATLSELAGLPAPRHQGLSFAPLLHEPDRPWKSAAFSQYPRGASGTVMGRSLRTDRFRYTEWRDDRSGELLARELYDHGRDPGETANVAAEPGYAAELEPLASRLAAGWRAALPAPW